MNPPVYSAAFYGLPRDFLRKVTRLRPGRGVLDIALVWTTIAALVWLAGKLPPWAYPFAIFAIAGRQGALLQLVHEACHSMLHRSRRANHAMGRWLCAVPLGVYYDGYVQGHLRHHANTNTPKDPASDREKYRITDVTDPRLYLLFLKDLAGLTALEIFFSYKSTEEEALQSSWRGRLARLLQLCAVQLVLFVLLFHADVLAYLLFWLAPAMSAHMFLMRVRGIAEHGLAYQLGKVISTTAEGTFYTRSFLTEQKHYGWVPFVWIEKALIGSFSVHYHHEHHLYPGVPHYHLKELHRRLAPEVAKRSPDIYAKGYFAAAFRAPLPAAVEAIA